MHISPIRIALPLMIAALLAACAGSPPARYYTLLPAASGAAPVASGATGVALELQPVNLPLQVDQPQIMLRTAGDALAPVYSERWASPLGEELQAALSYALTSRLGMPDVAALGASAGVSVWRVQVDVQRFDMVRDGPALLDATWRVRLTGKTSQPALLCRSMVKVNPADSGIPALVQAQQEAVGQLAATMASAIRSGGKPPAGSDAVSMLGCSRPTT